MVEPAEESLMHVLAEHVRKAFNLREDQVHHDKQPFNNRITFDIPNIELVIQYGEYGEDLVLRQENLSSYSLENRELITRLGKGFDKILQQ